MPSPVQIRPFVVGFHAWPAPPGRTFLAWKTSISPVRMSRAIAPTQLPDSSCRSEVVNHSS